MSIQEQQYIRFLQDKIVRLEKTIIELQEPIRNCFMRRWSKSDEQYLVENYGKCSLEELATYFSTTRKAVRVKANKLLKKQEGN